MKRINAFLLIVACLIWAAVGVQAGLDVSGHTYTTLAASTSDTNGVTTTTAVDVAALKGIGKIVVFDSGDISGTSTQSVVVVQTSTTGTSSWSNVTAPTFGDATTNATIESENVDTDTLSKYIRLQMTIGGTNAVQHYFGGQIITHR